MKKLVSLFQYSLILIILYPVYYIWQTDKVAHFCSSISSIRTTSELYGMAEHEGVNVSEPISDSDSGVKWHILVEPMPFINHEVCLIKGLGDKIASTKLISHDEVP